MEVANFLNLSPSTDLFLACLPQLPVNERSLLRQALTTHISHILMISPSILSFGTELKIHHYVIFSIEHQILGHIYLSENYPLKNH